MDRPRPRCRTPGSLGPPDPDATPPRCGRRPGFQSAKRLLMQVAENHLHTHTGFTGDPPDGQAPTVHLADPPVQLGPPPPLLPRTRPANDRKPEQRSLPNRPRPRRRVAQGLADRPGHAPEQLLDRRLRVRRPTVAGDEFDARVLAQPGLQRPGLAAEGESPARWASVSRAVQRAWAAERVGEALAEDGLRAVRPGAAELRTTRRRATAVVGVRTRSSSRRPVPGKRASGGKEEHLQAKRSRRVTASIIGQLHQDCGTTPS